MTNEKRRTASIESKGEVTSHMKRKAMTIEAALNKLAARMRYEGGLTVSKLKKKHMPTPELTVAYAKLHIEKIRNKQAAVHAARLMKRPTPPPCQNRILDRMLYWRRQWDGFKERASVTINFWDVGGYFLLNADTILHATQVEGGWQKSGKYWHKPVEGRAINIYRRSCAKELSIPIAAWRPGWQVHALVEAQMLLGIPVEDPKNTKRLIRRMICK